jgi:hypothetical protein
MSKYLELQVGGVCRQLLSQQDRDPYSLTYGCFDRRHWGWKLADYPDATLQRNVYVLVWLYARSSDPSERSTLLQAVKAGLSYACNIQHSDGSFDQAFPNERSYGATAFLFNQLFDAYNAIADELDSVEKIDIEKMLRRAIRFLCDNNEGHGVITNHLASAALALMQGGELFGCKVYSDKGEELLDSIIQSQSDEGWFPEYEGADPGYQSLCLYYLARIWRMRGGDELLKALDASVSFLAWFVHPDGSYAGEYGSRRTSVFYPGGFAILSRKLPLASRLAAFMIDSFKNGATVTLSDMDVPNIAPLATNYIEAIDSLGGSISSVALPFECDNVVQDFKACGIYVRGTAKHYAIFGAANGGVIRVFDKLQKKEMCNDTGYIGKLSGGAYITTQVTRMSPACEADENSIRFETSFYKMTRRRPTPSNFLVLRLANLTVMRSKRMREWVKRCLVKLLIKHDTRLPIDLVRKVELGPNGIEVKDDLRMGKGTRLEWLEHRRPFISIHMASSKYFEGYKNKEIVNRVDVSELAANGKLGISYEIRNA